ncbi:MAG: hypothetical protein ISN26_00100, partial [Betaproteobacteria bacterium AqS2]|nr:hypothetical protein [Betaproteobacteria bacterium AqS2]
SCASNPSTPAALTQQWRLTIAETADWAELGRDEDETTAAFSPIVLARADNGTDTGLAFHRNWGDGSGLCQRVDVALGAGAPSYLQLRRYRGTDASPSSGLSDIRMQTGASDDDHARLFFAANAAVTAGDEITIAVVGTPNSACADPRTPGPVTVE